MSTKRKQYYVVPIVEEESGRKTKHFTIIILLNFFLLAVKTITSYIFEDHKKRLVPRLDQNLKNT
jgi:hypothetical protein